MDPLISRSITPAVAIRLGAPLASWLETARLAGASRTTVVRAQYTPGDELMLTATSRVATRPRAVRYQRLRNLPSRCCRDPSSCSRMCSAERVTDIVEAPP